MNSCSSGPSMASSLNPLVTVGRLGRARPGAARGARRGGAGVRLERALARRAARGRVPRRAARAAAARERVALARTRRSSRSSRRSPSRSRSRCSGSTIGALIRSRERAPRRAVRSTRPAACVAGALIGFAIVWVLGAMALQLPGQAEPAARGAALVRAAAAERDRAAALAAERARADRPVPELRRPAGADRAARPARARASPGVRAAAPSVVRVLGTACGLGVEGSGWVAAPRARRHRGARRRGRGGHRGRAARTAARCAAQAVAFDPHNDVAVLRVDGLDAPPLRLEDPQPGRAGRDRRLPAERPARGERRADRRDRDRARAGRVRRRPDPPRS